MTAKFLPTTYLRHEPGCTRPGVEEVPGSKGDPMRRCVGCRAWGAIRLIERIPDSQRDPSAGTLAAPLPMNPVPLGVISPMTERHRTRTATAKFREQAARAAVPENSAYRCRTHPDEPVTAKGTGCASCRPSNTKSRRQRPAVGQ